MSFEKKVLLVVSKVMAAESFAAEFVNGTLFVDCNARCATKIQTALMENMKCGIIVGKVDNEFAFDFV